MTYRRAELCTPMRKPILRNYGNGSIRIWKDLTALPPQSRRIIARLGGRSRGSRIRHTSIIARIRAMVAILENHGVHVRMITGERLGYVVYEDEYQVVAEPFADRRP
jgi:hypothetical protein